jgi:hypothetical protein
MSRQSCTGGEICGRPLDLGRHERAFPTTRAIVEPLTSITRIRGIGVEAAAGVIAVADNTGVVDRPRPVPSISLRRKRELLRNRRISSVAAARSFHAIGVRRGLRYGYRGLEIFADCFDRQDMNARHDRRQSIFIVEPPFPPQTMPSASKRRGLRASASDDRVGAA